MNNLPRIKADLIATLDQGRAKSRALVERLPPDLPVHAGSGWTVSDLIIHLTALESDMVAALQHAMDEKPFSVDLRGRGTVNELYELRRAERAGESWQQLLAEWQRARDQLRALVIAFPIDKTEIAFSNPFFLDYNLVGAIHACSAHERLHLAEMRAASQGQPPD
ncbi:MAG: maleylpyruvate isomerase N-terminal domain-containing protein [Chloroflexi bacterium]|nr:maleylpyruvate isomerase N-terminal domain-containing protein [Chloroflexota bacterium]